MTTVFAGPTVEARVHFTQYGSCWSLVQALAAVQFETCGHKPGCFCAYYQPRPSSVSEGHLNTSCSKVQCATRLQGRRPTGTRLMSGSLTTGRAVSTPGRLETKWIRSCVNYIRLPLKEAVTV